MIIIVIELIWVLVDGMNIEAFRWVALAKALVTPRVFLLHSRIFWVLKICQDPLTIVGVLAGGSGYIHPGQKEPQLVGDFIGWVVRSLLKSQGQEQQTSMTVRYLDGFVWEFLSHYVVTSSWICLGIPKVYVNACACFLHLWTEKKLLLILFANDWLECV